VRARLYVDEDVFPDLARYLRSIGQDAVSAHDVGALGLDDEEQLARATADQRAMFSFNYRDFLRINGEWFVAGRQHAGIIVSYRQYTRAQVRQLAEAIVHLLNTVAAEDLENVLRVLGPSSERTSP
jgi:hypothetical protein